MREFLKGFLLGTVQGVTEFFPVSSTAHLIIVSELLGISDEVRVSFDISVQVSSVFALIVALSSRLKSLIQDHNELKETLLVVALACLWFIGVAVFFEDVIKTYFFVSSKVWFGLILGSIFLLLGLLKQQPGKAGFWKVALFVSFFQSLAIFPGVSRSGGAIAGGLLAGLSFRKSVELSFLMAVPLLSAACLWEMINLPVEQVLKYLELFLGGFIAGGLSSFLAIKFLSSIQDKKILWVFLVYRLLVAGLLISFY